MAKIDTVRPGDPIKADAWNALVAYVMEIEARLAKLETSTPGEGPPTGLRLASEGPLYPGDWAILLGQFLGASGKTLNIRLDGVLVSQYDSTLYTDTAVRFRVPAIQVDQSPKSVIMVVSNAHGQASLAVQLARLEAPLPRDVIDIDYKGVEPQTLSAGAAATFKYTLGLQSSQEVTFALRASLVPQSGPLVSLAVQQANGAPLEGGKLHVVGPGVAAFQVRAVAGQISSHSFRLVLTVEAPKLAPFTIERDFQLGAQQSQDPLIALGTVTAKHKIPNSAPKTITDISDTGDECTIKIDSGREAIIEVPTLLSAPAPTPPTVKYVWKLGPVGGDTSQWLFTATSGSRSVDAAEFPSAGGAVSWTITLNATHQPGAGAATWLVEVSREGQPSKKTKRLILSIKP